MIWLEILTIIVTFLVGFFVSFVLCKKWIKLARANQLVGKDMNKYEKKMVAEAGGIAVVVAIVASLMIYLFFKTFILNSNTQIIEILTLLITFIFACFIGFIDDILGWKKGIAGWKKILITIPVAIPLIVINAGHSIMSLPFIGPVNFGIIYPLVIVPLALVGTTNGYNLLAGFNGLESGLGILIFLALGIVSLTTGQLWLALIAGIIICALIGFWIFNKFPAKVFPGDSLTYSLGALVGCFAILGNMEKVAFFLFIPFILEGFLKLRSKFKAENFAIPNRDNSLELRYKKNYSLTHIALRILKKMKGKAYEKDVVYLLLVFELILILFTLINLFFNIL